MWMLPDRHTAETAGTSVGGVAKEVMRLAPSLPHCLGLHVTVLIERRR